MQGVLSFKDLTIEEKRDHIRRLFSPIVDNMKDWRKHLEIFVLSAPEEKLEEFYNATMSWNKEYLAKLISDIKSKKTEINKLNTKFWFEIMNHKEQEEKQKTETNLDKQLLDL